MPVHEIDRYKVQEIKALQGLDHAQEAEQLLKKIALQVQPIMRKRQLSVPLLTEFFPRQANLLGLNHGGGCGGTKEIDIRLRQAHNKSEFLPYTSVLCTMLHELCHNHIGPHNSSFYALLGELTKECEDLMARGVYGTGAGFDAAAAGKVGGRWKNPSEAERRLAILQAAEKRSRQSEKLGRLMPGGPHQLGGWKTAASPAEAAALAAMRRKVDQEACGCDEMHGTQVSYDKSKGEVIVLDKNEAKEAESSKNPLATAGMTAKANGSFKEASSSAKIRKRAAVMPGRTSEIKPKTLSGGSACRQSTEANSRDGDREKGPPQESELIDLTSSDWEDSLTVNAKHSKTLGGHWQCPICTFRNTSQGSLCQMCQQVRL